MRTCKWTVKLGKYSESLTAVPLSIILWSIIPTFVDIAIALVISCIILAGSLLLLFSSRQMNERNIITRGIHTDCLLNYET
ncbi:hypothetical protein GGU11DRAFT_195062 [Lentinula aff. detonsa]|nr:hypothetical protein GGU11DRAFT_195062 [Lentinula aff. detonsa]